MRKRPSIPFLVDLLRLAMRREATAVYVVPWMPPTLRVDERTVPLSSVAFTPEQSTLLVMDLLDDAQRSALNAARDTQFSLVLPEVGRFRVHAFRRHGQPAMAIRPFALEVPQVATMGLPAAACQAALAPRGLLLLASRSVTLRRDAAAALLQHRNQAGSGDLLVPDDISRYWHEPARCRVRHGLAPAAVDDWVQRQCQRHPAGLPQPLAIAWGEVRDGPQLERALRWADRALCVVTLQADSLAHALGRVVTLAAECHPDAPANSRPEGGRPAGTWFGAGQGDVLHRAAIVLHSLLMLRPVPAADGSHDLAATEILPNSPELAADLAEADYPALAARLSSAGGLPDADAHLADLVAEGRVKADDAQRHAVDRERFAERAEAARAAVRQAEPSPEPLAVDTGFADVFTTGVPPMDPFEFAEAPPPPAADTQFDSVGWAEAGATLGPATRGAGAPSADAAQFHAFAPRAVVPGTTVAVDVWAALPSQAEEVAVRAVRRLPEQDDSDDSDDTGSDAAIVKLQLRIDGVLPGPVTRRLPWTRQPARARLQVAVPPHTPAGPHAARLRLLVAGLPIGELSFLVNVMPNAAPDAPLENAQAARRMLQSAYAAYANADRAAVLHCVQQLQRVAPALDVFSDAPRLRTSLQWREQIEREVARRERLFLFWSGAAADSPWVDFEWRYMWRSRGSGAIETLLLEPPLLAPLPPELADQASAERYDPELP